MDQASGNDGDGFKSVSFIAAARMTSRMRVRWMESADRLMLVEIVISDLADTGSTPCSKSMAGLLVIMFPLCDAAHKAFKRAN